MTITITLPEEVEQAEMIVSHAPIGESGKWPELIEKHGVPVLRTGRPMDAPAIEETIEAICEERDYAALGQRYVDLRELQAPARDSGID